METVSVIKEVPKSNGSPFKRNPDLYKHIVIVCDNPVKYKCTVCNKCFKSKANCSYHKNCPNDFMKQHECEICKRRFSVRSHYNYHLLTHNGSNPYSCSICGKSFKAKNKLRRHEEVHAEKRKSYPCSKCEKSFLGKTSLKNHLRSHNGEKLFCCYHCSKAFTEKKNLVHHLNSLNKVKNWVCEVCGSSFVVKWNLELHRRTHFATRSLKCPDCPTKFLQKRYLIRHMELHRKTYKFECETCHLEFSRKDNLRRHNLRHLEEQEDDEVEQCEKPAEPNNGSEVSTDESVAGEANCLGHSSTSESVVKKASSLREVSTRADQEATESSSYASDKICRKSGEETLSTNAAQEPLIVFASRKSVIKSVSASTICNQVSVIKDGRRESAIICSAETNLCSDVRSAPKFVPLSCDTSRGNSVIESTPVPKPCSNHEKEDIRSRLSSSVQNNIREKMSMMRRCPIPKKIMAASYMSNLYARSAAANSSAEDGSRVSTISFVQSDSSRCMKYCDNNLLDLSMKSHGESCY